MADTILCPELLDKIFSFLKLEDLLRASEVSETWNSVARLSLKRRLFLQVHDVDPEDEMYALLFRECETQGPAKIIEGRNEEDDDIEESVLKNLKFDGLLRVPYRLVAKHLPLLAISLMPDSWSSKITTLHFAGVVIGDFDGSDDVEYKQRLAVQDWNVAGNYVLSKFPSLKKLKLQMEWVQDYVSTLQVPVVPEAMFESIETITVNFIGLLWLLYCQDFCLQLAYSCPNLQKFEINVYDDDNDITFVAKYKKLEGTPKLKLLAVRDMFFPPEWEVSMPMLKTLPFTFLKLDCSLETLQLFESSAAANVKTLCVILHSETVKAVAKDVDFVLAALCSFGFSALEDLQLRWTETDGDDSTAQGKTAVEPDFTLPSVKRLQLGGIDLGWEDADWSATKSRLLKALLNVELLVVHCTAPMHNLNPYDFQCSTRHIYPIRFLRYSSEFKQLRHLVWDWDFCKKNPMELRRLMHVPKYLARHQALESLTIRLAVGKPLPGLQAVVDGCAALPRMRLLEVFVRSDVELAQSPEFQNIESKATSFSMRMAPSNGNLVYKDFQIALLDQRCRDVGESESEQLCSVAH